MQIEEIIFFGLIMTFFQFIVSYITDFLSGRDIIWVPVNSKDMVTGTFFTSVIVYVLFSERYLERKRFLNNKIEK